MSHADLKLVAYDDELAEDAAWKLCTAAGHKYGRGPVEEYRQRVADVILALDAALEDRQAEVGGDPE